MVQTIFRVVNWIIAVETGHALSLQLPSQSATISHFYGLIVMAKNHDNPLNPSNHGSDNFRVTSTAALMLAPEKGRLLDYRCRDRACPVSTNTIPIDNKFPFFGQWLWQKNHDNPLNPSNHGSDNI